MPRPPSFSIVINTDSRARSLAVTLQSLRHLDYSDFEVCVVYGPTPDGTPELVRAWGDQVKSAPCPVRHLSLSRNIGIALAAGEIVAFLDDDAMPEPEWLRDLARAYEDPAVGAAGGFVYDRDGVSFQYRHVTMNRLGDPDFSWERPAPEFNFPGSANFPHLLGTNCSFRREALLAIGGFDENYERFLEESDVCCRMVDAGWKIAQIEGAYVHHKQLADDLRTEERIIRRWYPIVRSKVYFTLMNARGADGLEGALAACRHFIRNHRGGLTTAIWTGKLAPSYRARFETEVSRAWHDGLNAALSGRRKLMADETLRTHRRPRRRFPSPQPTDGRCTFGILTQNYPPGEAGGIARSLHQLARSVAELGHHVHVFTRGRRKERIDFEDGVWVHRIAPQRSPKPAGLDPSLPQHIWDYSAAMLAEAKRIARRRPLNCLYAPLWDCEGMAALVDGVFPLVLGLQTPMHSYLASHAHLAADPRFMRETGAPLLSAERRLLEGVDGVHANSRAIVEAIERDYRMSLAGPRTAVIPLGLEDWSTLPADPVAVAPDEIRLLSVGRLEARKGTDVLLPVLQRLLRRYPQLRIDLIGNDKVAAPDGRTYRAGFEAEADASIRARVHFHGESTDAALRGFYRACDIFVAPSRFESFGLTLIEAMMFAKPVVACRAGGMIEVVADGISGLLAEPGDQVSLESALARLIEDEALRRHLGAAGRRRYEECFTPTRMAEAVVELMTTAANRRLALQSAAQ